MRPLAPIILLTTLFFATAIATVAATGGYGPRFPIIRVPVTVTPAPPFVSGMVVNGTICITYPDGTAVVITETTTIFRLCGSSGCVTVDAALNGTNRCLGGYTYLFTIPTGLSGVVTIILPAGSLTDVHGTGFPGVNTVIGTFTVGSSTTSAPAAAASSVKYSKEPQGVMHTTTPLEQASQPQISLLMPTLLALLSIVGVALVAIPKKA